MQEFKNTSRMEYCKCIHNNECYIQVRNNGFCFSNCSMYKHRYKNISASIEKLYLKKNNIDVNMQDKCKDWEKHIIDNIIPDLIILFDAVNACYLYEFKIDLKNGDFILKLNKNNKVYALEYHKGDKYLLLNDSLMYYENDRYKKPQMYRTQFYELLRDFNDNYLKFEKTIYDRIDKLLEG